MTESSGAKGRLLSSQSKRHASRWITIYLVEIKRKIMGDVRSQLDLVPVSRDERCGLVRHKLTKNVSFPGLPQYHYAVGADRAAS